MISNKFLDYTDNTILNNKVILVTGGTGSFGNSFLKHVLDNYTPKKLIILSRDENKQYLMAQKYNQKNDFPGLFLENKKA